MTIDRTHHGQESSFPRLATRATGRRRHGRRGWALALLLLTAVACDSVEEKETRHLERGLELVEDGDGARAMVEFQNVLRLNPKNAEALFQIGQIHEGAGRLPEAYEAYRQAAAERQDFVAAHARLGAIALAVGDLEAAAAAAAAIEEVAPEDTEGLAIRGSLALRHGEIDAARQFASRALEAEPGNQAAVVVLAAADHRSGDTGRAIERLDAAIAAAPDDAELRITKIMLLEQRVDAGAGSDTDVEAITRAYDELLTLQPENALHRLALADFHRRQADIEQAQSVLRTAVLDDGLGSPNAAASLVRLVREHRGFEAAVRELEALMRRHPDEVALRFLLADLHASEGQLDAAESELAAIVDEAGEGPTTDDARAAMARIRLAAGDQDGARELATEVLAANGEHRGANHVLGTIDLLEGRTDEAIRRARTTLRISPNWTPGLRLLAEAHLATGETSLAIDALRQVVALDPTDVRSATRLARSLAAEGDHGAAIKLWDHVARVAEDPSAALQARAELQMRQGNLSAAREDIGRLLETPGQELTGTLMVGDLMLLQRRFDESRDWFAKAAALRPEASQPALGVARSYIAEGHPEGALAYLEQRVRDNPEDAAAFDLMGLVLVRQDRSEDAEQAFRDAIRLQPRWLEPYRRLGRVLREGGDAEAAAAVYRDALAQAPNDVNLLNELAFTYYRAGDYGAAADTYGHLLDVRPESGAGSVQLRRHRRLVSPRSA